MKIITSAIDDHPCTFVCKCEITFIASAQTHKVQKTIYNKNRTRKRDSNIIEANLRLNKTAKQA